MAKQKKQPRPRAETPKGFRDYFGAEVSERAAMLQTIAGVYHRYGFEALESPAVETVEAMSTGPMMASSPGPTRTRNGWRCAMI